MANFKKVTMNDVAKMAGVSQTTVSMVFSGTDEYKLPTETIEKVQSAASALGYISKKQANINNGSKLLIAFFPTMKNLYYATILETMRSVCAEKGFLLLSYCTLRDSHEENILFDMINEIPVAGIIFSYLPSNVDGIKKISHKIPTVIIGDTDNDLDIDSIEMNSEKSGKLLANHLLSLGHKKIAYITTSLSQMRRLKGIQIALNEAGVTDSLVVKIFDFNSLEVQGYDEYKVGFDLAKEVVRENSDVTAMVGISDTFALGIIDAISDAGFSVPKDYSVVGCDNTFVGELQNIQLTSVDLHAEAKGQQAIELLIKKIKLLSNETDIPQGIIRVKYEPRLIVRGTTGPIRTI